MSLLRSRDSRGGAWGSRCSRCSSRRRSGCRRVRDGGSSTAASSDRSGDTAALDVDTAEIPVFCGGARAKTEDTKMPVCRLFIFGNQLATRRMTLRSSRTYIGGRAGGDVRNDFDERATAGTGPETNGATGEVYVVCEVVPSLKEDFPAF